MDVKITQGGMSFEWDSEKEKINIKKHNVPFSAAIKVFFDENRVEYYDKAHSDDEDRYVTIGLVNDVAVVMISAVVYTERGESIRIISARAATKTEKEMYFYDN